MPQQFTNQAKAALVGNITALSTSLSVSAALADLFPVGDTADWGAPLNWFKAVIVDNTGQMEIIKVGTRAAGSAALSNILRAQDGTTAKSFTAGSAYVVHGPIASDFQNALAGVFANLSASGNLDVAGKLRQGGLEGRFTPAGGIIMWSGAIAAIPAGWALCDGTNGTPDLRDKFVIGAGTDSAGASQTNITGAQTKSGGAKDAVIPSHTHGASFAGSALAAHNHGVTDPTHSHSGGEFAGQNLLAGGGLGVQARLAGVGSASNTAAAATGISVNAASAGTPAGSVTVNATGTAATNANLPPYYALAFIQCLAA